MSTYHQRKKLIRSISQKLFNELTIKESYTEVKEVVDSLISNCFSDHSAFIYFQPENYLEFELDENISLDLSKLQIQEEEQLENLRKLAAFFFKLKWEIIMSSSRKRELVLARQLITHWLKHNTSWTLNTIARFIGGQDHSTVIHSVQTIEDQISVDRMLLNLTKNLNQFLNVYIEQYPTGGLGETLEESGNGTTEDRKVRSGEKIEGQCLPQV